VPGRALLSPRVPRRSPAKNSMILSPNLGVQDLIAVYQTLADFGIRHPYRPYRAVHGLEGIVASSAASASCCSRASAIPSGFADAGARGDRTLEVQSAQDCCRPWASAPSCAVAACPGCGRTTSTTFQELARSIQDFIRVEMPGWKTRYPGVESLNVAIMAASSTAPANPSMPISDLLPGTGETPAAPVFVDGKKFRTCAAPTSHRIQGGWCIDYIDQRTAGAPTFPPAR